MTFAEFQRLVKDGSAPPVLVFHGEEPYLARLGVEILKRALLPQGSEAFDSVSLSGREASAEEIVAEAGTIPMLAPKRLTIVYEVERLSPPQRTKILEYVRDPADTSVLALVSFGRIEGSNRFEKSLLQTAATVDCGRPSPETLAALVARMSEERGKTIEHPALSALIDWTDGGLHRIRNELDKLRAFVGDRETIALEDVEAVVGTPASCLRDLAVAVAAREPGRALALLEDLLESGGIDEAQLVSQLYAYWMALWLARSSGGRPPGGASWSARRAYESLATGGSVREMAGTRTSRQYSEGIELFYRADVAIRRGVPAGPTVGLLVYELAGGSGAGA